MAEQIALTELSREQRRRLVGRLQQRRQGEAPPLRQVIPRRPEEGPQPLSFSQQRLWFLDQLEPGGNAYNIPMILRLEGPLRIDLLARSLDEIVARHETLRTTFASVDGEPVQLIAPPPVHDIPVVDLTALAPEIREATLRRLAAEEVRSPFDLSRGPVLRLKLLRLAPQQHATLCVIHHIVSDNWSMGVFARELMALYAGLLTGRPAPLPELPIQYADFARWQREWLRSGVVEEQLAYWKRQLASPLPVLELPTDRPRPAVQTYRGAHRNLVWPASLAESLRVVGRSRGASLFMTALAAVQSWLGRYSGHEDVLIGSPVTNRSRVETEGLIGFFVNTLVLRGDLSGDPPFLELLERVREMALSAYAHQDLPFEKLVEELQPGRDRSRPPLFQVILVLQNAPATQLDLPGLSVSGVPVETGAARIDLGLELSEGPYGMVGLVEYSTDLFEGATVERLLGQLRTLLEALAEEPHRRLSDLPLLTPGETHQVLVEWNDSGAETAEPSPVHQLVARQAWERPDAPALLFEDRVLTYGELDRLANRLARRLRSLGVGLETPVGLLCERSPEAIAGMLGILKAGGCYVPLDPEYPQDRLDLMLGDADLTTVVAQERFAHRLAGLGRRAVSVDGGELDAENDAPLEAGSGLDNPVYIIYTSGSLGRPKGVVVHHSSLANFCRAVVRAAGLGPGERMLEFAPLSFDASALQIFPTLISGAALVLDRNPGRLSSSEILRLCERQGVTVLDLPAAVWRQWIEEMAGRDERILPRVGVFLTGGESLTADKLRSWARLPARSARLLSSYGPTEATVTTTLFSIGSSEVEGFRYEKVPLGRPLSDTRVYVLDSRRRPVPINVPGEIYIAGAGLARGYLGRPDLTAEAFVPGAPTTEPGERLYRTGDLARYLPDGQLEFLGRADHQVKIRGFRVELGEIEALLARHPAVREAVVTALPEAQEHYRLAAYILAEPGSPPTIGELRAFLGRSLPDFMVPSSFVLLDELPLLPSGKVNRRALPAPDGSRPELGSDFIAPRNPLEQVMAALWEELLKVERVGIHDDFFALGGHSLLATQLASRVRAAFQAEIPVRAVFDSPTVAGLAAVVEAARGAGTAVAPPLVAEPGGGPVPPSFAQQRLWFLDQLEPGGTAYNMPAAFRLVGPLDVDAIAASLGEVAARHETLRTTFGVVGGEPVQVIASPGPFFLPRIDLDGLPAGWREGEAFRLALADARRPFDLARGPLLRGTLLRLSAEEHVLLLTLHHVISDGWSIGILLSELAALYPAFRERRPSPLPPLPLQYADFARWQRAWMTGEVLATRLSYWRERLAGAPAVLELPLDHPRPPVATFRGSQRSRSFSPALTAALRTLSRREGATEFMTLLAAFTTLLARASGQPDILVATPIAGRDRMETEGLIGFFVNTLPLRVRLQEDPGFAGLLAAVRETTLSAHSHQDLPFEKLVEELGLPRNLSHNPLCQVMLSFQNLPPATAERIPGLTVLPFGDSGLDTGTAKLDLTLFVWDEGATLRANLEFNTDLFEAATVDRLLGHLESLLAHAAADPLTPAGELQILSSAERQALLVEWNDTAPGEAAPACLHDLVAAQAARTPEAVAAVHGHERYTYRELEHRASQLAHWLRRSGVRPETRVGVCLERSVDLLTTLLGVLKAGGAYVPVDPTYPEERIGYILTDSGVRMVVTQESLLARVEASAPDCPILVLDQERAALTAESGEAPASAALPRNLAYLIFTSGSTGRPKGVAIHHESAVAMIRWGHEVFSPEELRGVLASTSVCFDPSVFEIFTPLSQGGRVILAANALELPELPAASEVTLVDTVPSAIGELARSGGIPDSVLTVALAGEPLKAALAREIYERSRVRRVWNIYGPTEDTIYSTYALADRGAPGEPVIGRSVTGAQAYVLDAFLRPVPVEITGELYLAGAGLARGYHNRPDLTAERFIPSPYGAPGSRLYRTGDLSRRRADGSVDFLGRIDHQVKVRGFRIELGEIEVALLRHPVLREAVVVAHGTEEHRQLVAYVVTSGGSALPAPAELRAFLRESLPDYMLPAVFIPLEALPLNPHGKVDRRALPRPEAAAGERPAVSAAPRSLTEQLVIQIFAEVLGRDEVGAFDDFFELGGHSLLATRVVNRLREAFGVSLGVRALFENPTAAGVAASLAAMQQEELGLAAPPIVPVPRQAGMPLSFAQQRLFFLHRLQPESSFYNIPAALRFQGEMHLSALAASLAEVVRRHEVLRTTFREEQGRPGQVVGPAFAVPLPLADLRGLPAELRETEARRLADAEIRRPFDLGRGPLLRALLLQVGDEEHVGIFTLHHIVCDGWSISVLVREVAALYRAALAGEPSPLPALPVQYADFAHWERNWLEGEALERLLAYWKTRLAGAPPLLELPEARPRPEAERHRGSDRTRFVSAPLVEELRALCRRESATLFMALLAVLQTLLSVRTGSTDVVVGTDAASRNRPETEGLIGFFINQLALRTDLSGDPTFRGVLSRVREVALGAYAHEDLPFDRLIDGLKVPRSLRHAPLFQIKLVLHNVPEQQLDLPGLALRPFALETGTSQLDMNLRVTESPAGLMLGLEHNSDLYSPATIDRLLEQLEEVLGIVTRLPEIRLSEVAQTLAATDRQRREELDRKVGEAGQKKLLLARRRAVTSGS